MKHVGKRTRRVDGSALVKGKPVFADDMKMQGMLHIVILRSPHAHAVIKNIDVARAENMEGVACVLTHRNTRRHFYTTAGQGYPEPSPRDIVLLDGTVRYVGDRVAIVAADTLEIAEAAARLIEVKYEMLDAIFDPEQSIDHPVIIHPESGATGIHDAKRNIAAEVKAELGDVERALRDSAHVFSGTYSTPYVQQAHIEPHITLTWMDEHDRLIIRTSTQVPFHVRRIVAEVLDFPIYRIRVMKPRIGGGFGGKQEILNEEVCAVVTLTTGRPARIEMTRREELHAARSRHPQEVSFRLGINEDHTINAIDMRILENSGAYGPHALTVMSVTAQKALSLYRSPNIRVLGQAVYTNLPVAGAYRGYGAPQGFFALESLLDEIAAVLRIDPIDLRMKNYYQKDEEIPISRLLGEGREGFPVFLRSTGIRECLREGRKLADWDRKRVASSSGDILRGIGVATASMGSGIAGIDMGAVMLKMNEDASFNLLTGATDLGTGADTALAQIAAEVLEVPVEKFVVYPSDTDLTPFDTGAYGSSTTYISGGAVKKAAEKVRAQILAQGKAFLETEDAEIRDRHVIAADGRKLSYEEICTRSMYTDHQMQIMATASHMSFDSPPPFNATFAEVSVDTRSGLVTVDRVVSLTDAGQIINPPMAEGQVEGAIPQALGMALSEFMIFDEQGAPINTDFNSYHIYTARDMPELVVRFVHTSDPTGPFGAKAVAEIPINAPAAALANAIFNACGVRIRHLPVKPELLLRELKCAQEAEPPESRQ